LLIRFISSYLYLTLSQPQKTHQPSQQDIHTIISDSFYKNTPNQGLPHAAKANNPTTAPLGSLEPPSISSASIPPGLLASSRGRGRGRGSRPVEIIAGDDRNSWRSRPPPPNSSYMGGGRGGRGGSYTRGGYSSSPTSSPFLSARRGGRHESYHSLTTSTLHIHGQNQQALRIPHDDGEDAPPPGFDGNNKADCPPPGFNSSDSGSDDEGPPPGFEDEDDAPPPGFGNSNIRGNRIRDDLVRGGSGGSGGSGGGRGGGGYNSGQFNSSDMIRNSRGRGGRGGGGGALTTNTIHPPPGRGVKILEIPRMRPTSASSSYTNSLGSGHLNCISSSPAGAAGIAVGIGAGGDELTEHLPTLKSPVAHQQQPVFKDFIPSGHLAASFSPNVVGETGSSWRPMALGGVPATTTGGAGGSAATRIPTPEQAPPLIPPVSSMLQITPLYPQLGIKSIW
jgi:hypothetical protein